MLRKLPSSRFEVAAVVFLNANQANKKNRIYGNAANQVLRSSSDDNANISLFLIFHSIYILFLIIRLIFRVDTKARNEGVSW